MLAVILPWSGRVWRQRGPGSRHALVLGGQPCASRANRRSGSRGSQEATACTRRVGTPLLQSQEVDREVACSSDRDSAVRRTQRAAAPWQVVVWGCDGPTNEVESRSARHHQQARERKAGTHSQAGRTSKRLTLRPDSDLLAFSAA